VSPYRSPKPLASRRVAAAIGALRRRQYLVSHPARRPLRRRVACALLLGLLSAAGPPAVAQVNLDKAIALLGVTSIPDSTASAISISRGGSGDDLGLTFGQFGLGFTASEAFPVYMEGFLGYARYDPRFVLSGGAAARRVPTRLNQITGTLGVGWDFKLTEELVLRPILNGLAAYIASDASLFGAFVEYRRDVQLDVVAGGSSGASGWGGSLMLDYTRYRAAYELDAELRYTSLSLTAFDLSRTGGHGQANAQTLALWSRLRWPTGRELFGRPVRYLVEVAHSRLLGDQPGVLGFEALTKIGGGIEIDIGRTESTVLGFMYLERIRLVGRYVFANNVSGFSVGLGFGF